jgi:hypothetical protein
MNDMKRTLTILLAVLAVQTAAADLSQADTMTYGDFVATDYTFNGVFESSTAAPLPLFGSPTVSGDTLTFTPTNFISFAQDGDVGYTDSHLDVDITANAGSNIYIVNLSEKGSYALTGAGDPAYTSAQVTMPVWLEILKVNGGGINPITVQEDMVFTNAGFWAGGASSGSWQGSLAFDVTAVLRANGVPAGFATEVQLTLDDTLTTYSDAGTSAGIDKTQADISIPEPATISLLAAGMILSAARRRKNIHKFVRIALDKKALSSSIPVELRVRRAR